MNLSISGYGFAQVRKAVVAGVGAAAAILFASYRSNGTLAITDVELAIGSCVVVSVLAFFAKNAPVAA